MRKLAFLFVATLLLVSLLATSCGGSSIVGKWEPDTAQASLFGLDLVGTWEFFKDGTLTLTTMGIGVPGKYKLNDSKHMTITFSSFFPGSESEPAEFLYSIKGDTLTISVADSDEELVFKRK